MNEPQETTPLLNAKPATIGDLAFVTDRYSTQKEPLLPQHITVEIDGEYYQASLALTKDTDILDAGHLVLKPIL